MWIVTWGGVRHIRSVDFLAFSSDIAHENKKKFEENMAKTSDSARKNVQFHATSGVARIPKS